MNVLSSKVDEFVETVYWTQEAMCDHWDVMVFNEANGLGSRMYERNETDPLNENKTLLYHSIGFNDQYNSDGKGVYTHIILYSSIVVHTLSLSLSLT